MSFVKFLFTGVESEVNREKTIAFHQTVNLRDARLFTPKRSVLYTFVKKSEWKSCERFFLPSAGASAVYLWPTVPRFELLRTCFPDESKHFLLQNVYGGTGGFFASLSEPTKSQNVWCDNRKIVNNEYLIVALILYDYDILFANFNQKFVTVCSTNNAVFGIDFANVTEMQMKLLRPIDKLNDVCAVFDVSIHNEKHIGANDTLGDLVEVPDQMTIKMILSKNAVTPEQKRIDVESYFPLPIPIPTIKKE